MHPPRGGDVAPFAALQPLLVVAATPQEESQVNPCTSSGVVTQHAVGHGSPPIFVEPTSRELAVINNHRSLEWDNGVMPWVGAPPHQGTHEVLAFVFAITIVIIPAVVLFVTLWRCCGGPGVRWVYARMAGVDAVEPVRARNSQRVNMSVDAADEAKQDFAARESPGNKGNTPIEEAAGDGRDVPGMDVEDLLPVAYASAQVRPTAGQRDDVHAPTASQRNESAVCGLGTTLQAAVVRVVSTPPPTTRSPLRCPPAVDAVTQLPAVDKTPSPMARAKPGAAVRGQMARVVHHPCC